MIQTLTLSTGVTLRCYTDQRFKQGRLSLQLVRPMCREEAAMNALLPMVLLRGTARYPDLRAITMRLDDLYGASVGDLVRRVGDYQTTGLYCGFAEDRFAMAGDEILAPVVALLGELLLDPVLESGVFREEYVQSEKRNLICDIEAQRNDKTAYAGTQLLKTMCREDPFAIPRLGEREQVEAITAQGLYEHYRRILRESRIELFYVGSAPTQRIAELVMGLIGRIDRCYVNLPPQSVFHDAGPVHNRQEMDIAQSRLCMGFVTSITNRDREFAAMQVLNTVLGAGMTSKLFLRIREEMSLCYSIGSGYYGSKGIITVSAGIDADKEDVVRREVLAQLAACAQGDITPQELAAARAAVLSSLRSVTDSPGTIEGYFATAALSGLWLDLSQYRQAVTAVTGEDVRAAAETVRYHSSFFLKGVSQ